MERRGFAGSSVLLLILGATLTTASAYAAKPRGGSASDCVGAVPSFVFNGAVSGSTRKDIVLANATATCTRLLFSVTAGSYTRTLSFRIVETDEGRQGRVLATDGLNVLRLVRFTIGDDMVLSDLKDDVTFAPSQPGFIDESFDLHANGHQLVYLNSDEDAISDGNVTPADARVYRMRVLPDVDACAGPDGPCAYDAGSLVAERTGASNRLEFPRWNVAGAAVLFMDFQGDAWNPDVSRIEPSSPTNSQTATVVSGESVRELMLYQVRPDPVHSEVVIYGGKPLTGPDGSNYRDLRIGLADGSVPGSLVNSSTRLLVGGGAAQLSVGTTSRPLLVDGAKESKSGVCSSNGTIVRATDSGTSVQVSTLTSGFRPATP